MSQSHLPELPTTPTPTPIALSSPISLSSISVLDNPLGQSDLHPKVQICLEYRNKEIVTGRSTYKRTKKILEVTVMWVKNLPHSKGRRPNPVVKLRLIPGDVIHTTELKTLKTEKNEAQYIEIFEFQIDNTDLKKSSLELQVCDRKVTRNAKVIGSAVLELGNLTLGQPLIKWHNLKVEGNKDQDPDLDFR